MATTSRKPYQSDLTDEQWSILQPLIPPAKPGGRPREVDMRAVINTILYLNRTGCQWDMLPHDLLPKSTVYEYFAQWRDDDTWQHMMDTLREQVRQQHAVEFLGDCPGGSQHTHWPVPGCQKFAYRPCPGERCPQWQKSNSDS